MVLLSDHYNLGYLMLAIYQGLSLAPITSQVINNYEPNNYYYYYLPCYKFIQYSVFCCI